MRRTIRFGYLVLALGVLGGAGIRAQGFIQPVTGDGKGQMANNETTLVNDDGTEINGTLKKFLFSMGALKNVTILDDAGVKTKYLAADLQGLKVKTDKLMKLTMFTDDGSIVGMATQDYEEIADRTHVIFERVLMPGKKQKYRLLQIVNPGFDSRLKVYYNPNPNANTSGGFMGITKVTPDTYLVVKDGARADVIKKGDYKKQFDGLYADCAEMTAHYGTKKARDWDYFPEHVFVYDQTCRN